MRRDKLILPSRFRHLEAEHWRDMDELHEVLHSLSNYFKALTFELLDKKIFDWLFEQLKESTLTREQLEARFAEQFCEQSPKILVFSGMSYRLESSADLARYLDQFVKLKKLVRGGDEYILL